MRAISLGGSIIDTHQNPAFTFVNTMYHTFKQYGCNYLSFLADRADEIIERLIVPADTGRAEPTGNSPASLGEDDSGYENRQSPSAALVKYAAKRYYQNLPVIREHPFAIHRLSFPYVFCVATQNIGKDEPFLFANLYFKELC
jgi:hypothetical protein